jgi:hypothetical protein
MIKFDLEMMILCVFCEEIKKARIRDPGLNPILIEEIGGDRCNYSDCGDIRLLYFTNNRYVYYECVGCCDAQY